MSCARKAAFPTPRIRTLMILAGALLASMGGAIVGAPSASAAVTAPECPGQTTYPVAPGLLELTGQDEIDYEAGGVVLLYDPNGTDPLTPPLGGSDPMPPNCAVRKVDGQPVSAWAFCTDAYEHSCRNNGSPNFYSVTQNPKFDPAVDPLGPDKERVIVALIQHGYPIRDAAAMGYAPGSFSEATTDTTDEREALQLLVWCVSESGSGIKSASQTTNPDFQALCAANFTEDDFDAVLASIPAVEPPALAVAPEQPSVEVGQVARFTVTTNVTDKPIDVATTGVEGQLTVCGGDATLVGDELLVAGTGVATTRTVTLCGTRASAGELAVDLGVVPTTTQNLVWNWNGSSDCQVYATFNDADPVRLDAEAQVRFTAVPETPTTPQTPRTPVSRARTVTRKQRLGLSKTSNGTRFVPGQRVAYRLRVTNPSKKAVRNVRVCDAPPAGLSFVRATPKAVRSRGRYCWTVRSLGAGKSRSFTLVARVLSDAPSRVTNRATATSPDALTRTAKRTIRVAPASTRAGGVTG